MGEMTRAIEEVLLASGLVKLASKGAAHGEFKMRAKGKRKAGSDEVIRRPRVTGIQVRRDASFTQRGELELTVCRLCRTFPMNSFSRSLVAVSPFVPEAKAAKLTCFSLVHDQHGFRAHQTTNGPEWYNPPLRVALVCRRWLPVSCFCPCDDSKETDD